MNNQEHKCQCDFRIRMLGDGCRYCQPQEYIDRLHDTMDGMIHTDCFELTDEEIEKIGKQYLSAYAQFIGAGECHYEGEIEFARAILRKAQEADKIESLGTVNIGGVHYRNGKEVK